MYKLFGHSVVFPNLYSTFSAQFCPLYIVCTEEFPVVRLHARKRHIKQMFYTIIVLSDDGPKKKAETYRP